MCHGDFYPQFVVTITKFLSLVHGHWGERAAQMAERLNHKVYRLNISQTGDIFSLAQIEGWLKSNNQIKCNLFVFFLINYQMRYELTDHT